MNRKESEKKGVQVLSVEMYFYKGQELYRVKSGDHVIHGLKSVQEAVDARFDLWPSGREVKA